MLRFAEVGIITTGLVLGSMGIQPAMAANSCDVAIAEAIYQIETKNSGVTRVETFDMRESPDSDHPEDYPIGVALIINGSGAASVMNSPAFLTKLTHDIVMACGPVSKVVFGIYATDYIRSYGLLSQGKVAPFKCLSAGQLSKYPWGYTPCL